MDNEIMGSGSTIDIINRRPSQEEILTQQGIRAKRRLDKTMQEAREIAGELHGGSPVLRIFLERYRDRMVKLAEEDLECKTLKGVIESLRFKLEFAPALAEREALRILGPQLARMATPGASEEITPEK